MIYLLIFKKMNRLSSTLFGQLFYLRDGHFTRHGLAHAVANRLYTETFRCGPHHKHQSTLEFTYNQTQGFFAISSLIEMDRKYRETYMFKASQWGTWEQHSLFELQGGFIHKRLCYQDVEKMVEFLKQGSHVVYDTNETTF